MNMMITGSNEGERSAGADDGDRCPACRRPFHACRCGLWWLGLRLRDPTIRLVSMMRVLDLLAVVGLRLLNGGRVKSSGVGRVYRA
jgi:hypothetical protein